MSAGTRLLLFFLFVLFLLFFGWFAVRKRQEGELLKSKVYADAVRDWDMIQSWFVSDFESDFKPFSVMLDTGGFVAREITVCIGRDGRLFLPSDLGPMEFVVAVRKIKRHFGVEF